MNRRNLNSLLVNYGNNYSRIQELGSYQEQLKNAIAAFTLVKEEILSQGGCLSGLLVKQQECLSSFFDNGTKQPLQGLILLADRCPYETERIFADLVEPDQGNLGRRLAKLNRFREDINKLMEEKIGSMWKYEQSFRDVMTYQYLLDPSENFAYRYAEAKSLGDCIETADAVRSGRYFSLDAYYAMCRSVLREMKEQKNLRAYISEDPVSNGILYADLMMSAKKFDLYRNIRIALPTRRNAMGKAAREEELRLRREEMDMVRKSLAELNEKLAEGRSLLEKEEGSDGLIGKHFSHRKFGTGTVIQDNGRTIQLDFGQMVKSFQMPDALVKGFLKAESDQIGMDADEKYRIVEENKSLEKEINRLNLRLEVLEKMEA